MSDPSMLPVIVLVRDLIFASRISATARAEQCEIRLFRNPEQLADQPGRRLIVDLNLPGAIDAAAAWSGATGGTAIGFVSHVDGDTIAQARNAGIDQILARSQFVKVLPELLRG